MSPERIKAAAEFLATAWKQGESHAALPPQLRPADIAEGYAIQDALIVAMGEPVAGWKLGVGTPAQKRATGLGRAIAGRVLAPRAFRPGAAIRSPKSAPATVEFEIAFVLGRDVRPGDAPADPRALIAETRVAFEIVLSRFVDRRAVGWPSFAADNAAFEALVIGDAIAVTDIDAAASTLAVESDGFERARAATGDDATDPFASFADLLALAAERGWTLCKGAIVSTGALARPFDVSAPCSVTARFLNRTLSFTLETPQ